jgi:hypothetical protein
LQTWSLNTNVRSSNSSLVGDGAAQVKSLLQQFAAQSGRSYKEIETPMILREIAGETLLEMLSRELKIRWG